MSSNPRLQALLELEKIRNQIKNKSANGEMVKLHLGCGTAYKEGWINIDNNSDNNINKLDLNWDLRNNLPLDDNSVDFIFNEHFLEHLSIAEGQRALRDFLRVLKPSGIMRISMPDLERVVALYNNPNWKKDCEKFFKKFGLDFIKTKAEFININFRAWGHKWLYDWEELERRLAEAGAKEITKATIYKSKYPELNNLETRAESVLVAEVKKSI